MENFLNEVAKYNGDVNGFIWGVFGVVLLVGTGILMTVVTKVFQVSHIGLWMKKTIGGMFHKNVIGHTKDKGAISQFQALCTALAATVGVGNIAGVAAAIAIGGPGAVFWMWVAAFFGMMTNYSENVLGIYFRRRNQQGEWSGGSMYYLQDGLGRYPHMKYVGKILAILFSCFAVLASFGIGNMGQVNKIVANFTGAFDIPSLSNTVLFGSGNSAVTLYSLIIGLVLMVLVGIIVIGGLKRIAAVAEKIVPFMVVAYILGSLIIIGVNYQHILSAFGSIFERAFELNSAWGGGVGVTLSLAITQGFKRGVFSNEAGLGSSVMVHSNSNVREPVKQGMWGIFEVFADTMVICTMTSLVVLTSGVIDLTTGEITTGGSDATLVADAFNSVFKIGNFNLGKMFIAVAVLLFAFTTILGWSHYGSKAVEYLAGKHAPVVTKIYKVVFVLMIVSGAIMTSSLAWDISDTFNGLMMIPNLIGVISLCALVVKITKNYLDRRVRKLPNIRPILSYDPEIQAEQEALIEADGNE